MLKKSFLYNILLFIELLFKFDDLDYFCCNKNGDDALKNSFWTRDSYYTKNYFLTRHQ